METELNFYGKDPGAAKFGNFINYYSFHSANERIKNLNRSMFPMFLNNKTSILVLDIGCNTGELTIELKTYLEHLYPKSNICILAIDIDPTLIERAKCVNRLDNITYIQCNVMAQCGKEIIKKYLQDFKKKSFDITFCFSVTMWIHLNNGDEKFMDFLKFLKFISNTITIEPQPWKCYKNAQRRMRRSGGDFELFNSLDIRENVDSVVEKVLSEETHEKVYQSSSSAWGRIIQSYCKSSIEENNLL